MVRAEDLPAPPPVAEQIFGDRLPLAIRFAEALAGPGVQRGLIGPREVPRLWDRHLLNCAILEGEFAAHERVVDVGSGAGLPGLVLAIARPDLSLVLVEPMRRRISWLTELVDTLGLGGVELRHGRAESLWGDLAAPYVTARAVAPLASLAAWSVGLVALGGWLVAMKGETAAAEIARDAVALEEAGFGPAELVELGRGVVPEPTYVVRARLERRPSPAATRAPSPRKLSRSTKRQRGRRST